MGSSALCVPDQSQAHADCDREFSRLMAWDGHSKADVDRHFGDVNDTLQTLKFLERNIDITEITAIGEQEKIVSSIISIYNEKKRATIFLHGSCGTGKSTVGLLVAKEVGGSFCHTFNPTNPGDTLHLVVRESSLNEESIKPIIIVIEEANSIIHRIHTNQIELHKNIHTLVYNKSTYNTFLDDMILYKNVILILTSNESIEEISALDPCYLRKGRIDGSFSMMTPIVV